MEQAEAEAKEDKRLGGAHRPDPHQVHLRGRKLSEHRFLTAQTFADCVPSGSVPSADCMLAVCILNYVSSEDSRVKT